MHAIDYEVVDVSDDQVRRGARPRDGCTEGAVPVVGGSGGFQGAPQLA